MSAGRDRLARAPPAAVGDRVRRRHRRRGPEAAAADRRTRRRCKPFLRQPRIPSVGARAAAPGDRGRRRLPAPPRRRARCPSSSTRSASSGCGATTGWEERVGALVADARGRRGAAPTTRRRCAGPSGAGRRPSRRRARTRAELRRAAAAGRRADGASWPTARDAGAGQRGELDDAAGRAVGRPPRRPPRQRPGRGGAQPAGGRRGRARRGRPPGRGRRGRSATRCSPTGPSAAASRCRRPRSSSCATSPGRRAGWPTGWRA